LFSLLLKLCQRLLLLGLKLLQLLKFGRLGVVMLELLVFALLLLLPHDLI
jgi:hypothetical protein